MSVGDTRPDLPALPSAAEIVRYMRSAGWTHGRQGSHGAIWTRGDVEFSVPHEDHNPAWLREVVGRLASAEGRTPEETAAAILAHRSVAASALPVPDDSGRDLPSAPEKAQPRAATVTDQDVTAALLADVQFHKASRSLVWTSPSSEAVRAMLEAVAPRLVAAERERAERAEAKLAEVRERAADWTSTSAPSGDWKPTLTGEVMGNCGRAILAIIGTGAGDGNDC